jgi:hypothetical protein
MLFAEVHGRRNQADRRGTTQRRKPAANLHHPIGPDHQGKRERLLLPGLTILILFAQANRARRWRGKSCLRHEDWKICRGSHDSFDFGR